MKSFIIFTLILKPCHDISFLCRPTKSGEVLYRLKFWVSVRANIQGLGIILAMIMKYFEVYSILNILD